MKTFKTVLVIMYFVAIATSMAARPSLSTAAICAAVGVVMIFRLKAAES